MLIEIFALFVLPMVFAETLDTPYSPIITDKPVYSWTDKIRMKIIAPSWNANRHAVDSIGDTDEHPIKISTREHTLGPYRFTETDFNSGIFTAEVILTGFLHDVDGDGKFDTMPRTMGSGPTSGFLETDRDSAVTISFEFADGLILTESVPIRWNIATIDFSEEWYSEDSALITVVEPDLNLNPKVLNHISVRVTSDSDVAGIEMDAIETSEDSGVFVGNVTFTQDRATGGTILYAVPGDYIHAQYDDHTLPEPYSTSESLSVKDTARLDSKAPLSRVTNSEIRFTDSFERPLTEFSVASQIQIVGTITNKQEVSQQFVYILQIKDESGTTVSLSWIGGEATAHQSLDVSQSWMPENSGTYKIETFAWSSLAEPSPLSLPLSASLVVR